VFWHENGGAPDWPGFWAVTGHEDGPHFRFGRHLAALELRILLQAIAERIPGITLAGEVSRLRSNFINGIKRMHVRF